MKPKKNKNRLFILPITIGIIGGTLAFLIGFHAGPFSRQLPTQTESTPIFLATTDGDQIAGHVYQVNNSSYGLVISHSLGGNRGDVEAYAQQLASSTGITVIAIDLLGHGQSSGNWQSFTDADFQKLPNGYIAADTYLRSLGIKHMAYMGVDISANAALRAAVKSGSVESLILASPFLNDHGINTQDVIRQYTGNILISASLDDPASDQAASSLYGSLPKTAPNPQFVEYKTGGHGIDLLQTSHSDLAKLIRDWLATNFVHMPSSPTPTPSIS